MHDTVPPLFIHLVRAKHLTATPKTKRRVRKVIGWLAIGLVALIGVLLVSLLLVDLTVYRGPLQSGVTAFLGRSVQFKGAMSLRPSLWPKIVVEDVRVTNPKWASREYFSRAERLEVQVALLPLIRGDLRVLGLALVGTDTLLETRADGRNNWTFRQRGEKSKSKALPDIESLTWEQSVLGFRSSADRVYRVAISEANAVLTEGERIKIEAAGTYQDVPFTLSLLGGKPAELVSITPWPLKLTAHAADATIEVDGTITHPLDGTGFDLEVAVKGEQLEALSSLLDVALPALGSYGLSAHVTDADNRYRITNLTGHLDGADAVKRFTLTQGTVSASLDASTELHLEGTYADVPLTVSLMSGALGELTAPTGPWPLKLAARTASASVDIDGTVAKPLAWDTFDFKIAASGKEVRDLNPLIDAELPTLGDYALSARVAAVDNDYTVKELVGHVGTGGATNRVTITKAELSAARGKPINLTVQGRYRDVPFKASLVGGSLVELTTPSSPWPIKLKANAVGTTIGIDGTVAQPLDRKGLDLRTKISGQKLSALEPLLDIALPALGAYELSGRVIDGDDGYSVTGLKGNIGGTDVSGRLALDGKGSRPHVRAKLASKTLNLERLMAADAPVSSQDREPAALDLPLPIDMLRAIDADLVLDVKKLIGAPIAIDDLTVTAKLKNGQMTVTPIAMSMPGGRIKGRMQLDASGDDPRLSIELSTDQLDINRTIKALADIEDLRAAVTDLRIELAGRGKTMRKLLERSKFRLTTGAADVRYRTELAGRVVPMRLSKLEIRADPGQAVSVALEGVLRRLPFSLRLSGDTLANLAAGRETEKWPVAASGHVAGLAFNTKGVVIRPFGEEDFDLSFNLTGEDIDNLDPLLDVDLPTRGPYRLAGRFVKTDNVYRLTELDINLEDDHSTGSLTLKTDGPRPHITAKLVADRFHLEDFIEDVDETIGDPDDKRLFADFAIPVDALRAVDVDVDFDVTHVLGGVTDIGDISLKVKLKNGNLNVSLFDAVLAGGQVAATLDLDSEIDPPVASVWVTVKDLDYGGLLDSLEVEQIEGVGDIEINLKGRGATLHSLLGQLKGKAEFVSEAGRIKRGDVDLWAADLVTTMLSPKWQREKSTELNCLVARFDVTDGTARAAPVLLDTTRITVVGTGTLELGSEQLDVVLTPAPKKASFISLATPVRLTGTLTEPKVSITKKGKATTFGKILLPFVNPTYLLYSGSRGSGKNPCEAAIAGGEAAMDKPKKKRKKKRKKKKKKKNTNPAS